MKWKSIKAFKPMIKIYCKFIFNRVNSLKCEMCSLMIENFEIIFKGNRSEENKINLFT